MDCPACKEAMVVLELDEIEIDHCLSCQGTWLDGGELELLLEGADEKDKLLSSFAVVKGAKEKKRKCPLCRKKMEKVLCGTDKKVVIDRCRGNDGIWLDMGELNEIIRLGQAVDKDNRILSLLEDVFGKKG